MDKWKEGNATFLLRSESLFRMAFDVYVCVCVCVEHVCELNITDEWRRTAVGRPLLFLFVYLVD